MVIKHNKIKNIGLIYEMLVRQITTDILNNRDSKAISILKNYFNNTEIAKEYTIYKTISSAKHLSEAKGNILLEASISSYNRIDRKKINKEKYELIAEIKKNYKIEEFFKPKIDNYKLLASLYTLLENNNISYIDPSKIAKYKFSILEHISSEKDDVHEDEILKEMSKLDKGSRSLVYKLMINNFNERYSGLDKRQKNLLKEYIFNISTPDKFKSFINEEIEAIKNTLNISIKKIQDPARKIKLEEVVKILHIVPDNKKVDEKDLHNVLSYYELIKEIENVK